jgi:hypothetical protein
MARETNDRLQGLRLYNTNQLADEEGMSVSNFLTRECIVLCNDFIDLSRTTGRLSFMKDLRNLEIIPLPHQSTMQFVGCPERNDIASARQIVDRFYALTFSGDIYSWSMTTSKLIEYHKSVIKELDQYEIY